MIRCNLNTLLLTVLMAIPASDVCAGDSNVTEVAMSSSAEGGSSSVVEHLHTVEIKDFAFSPATLTVNAGDTVVFVNRDVVPHTATEATGRWDSNLLVAKRSWRLLITADTAWSYFCRYHPSMKGTLSIQDEN